MPSIGSCEREANHIRAGDKLGHNSENSVDQQGIAYTDQTDRYSREQAAKRYAATNGKHLKANSLSEELTRHR